MQSLRWLLFVAAARPNQLQVRQVRHYKGNDAPADQSSLYQNSFSSRIYLRTHAIQLIDSFTSPAPPSHLWATNGWPRWIKFLRVGGGPSVVQRLPNQLDPKLTKNIPSRKLSLQFTHLQNRRPLPKMISKNMPLRTKQRVRPVNCPAPNPDYRLGWRGRKGRGLGYRDIDVDGCARK